MLGTVALLPMLLLALVSTTARAEEPRPFSLNAWQQAANPSLPDWSRRDLLQQLAAVGGRAQVADVSVYRVYFDVQPLQAMRPPGVDGNTR